MLSFICFSVSLYCWAHNEKHSLRMSIDANRVKESKLAKFDIYGNVSNKILRVVPCFLPQRRGRLIRQNGKSNFHLFICNLITCSSKDQIIQASRIVVDGE